MILTILILSFLVLIHEFGHFLIAKLFHVRVEEFGIGLPPKALTIAKRGETEYTLNWLPIGGFVRMGGESEEPDADQRVPSDESHEFYAKPSWKRILILLAGVTMNLLVGITLFSIIYAKLGIPRFTGNQTVIADVAPGSPAEHSGLVAGDVVSRIGDTAVTTADEFVTDVNAHKGQAISLYVSATRSDGTVAGTWRQVTVVPRENPPAGQGALGVSVVTTPILSYEHKPWYLAPFYGVKEGLIETWGWNVEFVSVFTHPATLAQNLGGPVKVVEVGAQAAAEGWITITRFAAIISLNLALFNLLPIPALDGGRIVMVLLEHVVGRRRVAKVEGYVNTIGMVLLILLLAGVTVKDIFFK